MTTHARPIAILRADGMVGSDFILPVLLKRVLQADFPSEASVAALIREGGTTVEYGSVDVEADGDLARRLEIAFQDI